MATTINHDMDQGSDFSFTVVVKDADGNARNISTEYQAFCQMKKFYSSSESKSLIAAIESEGVIRVSLSAAVTTTIKPGVYFYDVELLGSDGAEPTPNTRIRVVQGMITVYPEVTK